MSARSAPAGLVAVLEIGGTHVTSGLVDTARWELAGPVTRLPVPEGSADAVLDAFAAAARATDTPGGTAWSVAIPDPFDYHRGVACFAPGGKFGELSGMDLRGALAARLGCPPTDIAFCHDAEAFLLGAWVCGHVTGAVRCAALTLGSGIGSAFLADGRLVHEHPGLPPGGRVHLLDLDGAPLEQTVSRAAVRRGYRRLTGQSLDVAQICARARTGEPAATAVLRHAYRGLGRALAPVLAGFDPDILVVGGSIAASWDLLAPFVAEGRAAADAAWPPMTVSLDAHAALLGAAYHRVSGQPNPVPIGFGTLGR
ncbi:ROK family protein [Kitasatospora sp. NPDC001603]|uniref:ROK family protein n=1 Tax=Kitasatospora sp. NPDC001603 TaxID=3154388 RepID=UPI00332B648E